VPGAGLSRIRLIVAAGLAVVIAVAALVVTQWLGEPPSKSAMHPTPKSKPASLKVTFEPAAFGELPGWTTDNHLAAFEAFRASCRKVIASAKREGADAPTLALAAVCRKAVALKDPSKATARAFFETHFAPHRVIYKSPSGFFTGYYEPVLKGSRVRTERYPTPIYMRPPDLVNVVDETERASKNKGYSHLRQTADGLEPYPTRKQIENGALKDMNLELLYLADPVDAFFMQVQGSGSIKLTDGTTVRVNYAGKNGHPYTSIGRYLVNKKLFPADRMSLDSLGEWLRADPERGRKVMWQNASFVFFRELKGRDAAGAMGAMSVTLTPGRSLAVDTAFHKLGTPVYVSAPTLEHATGKGGFNRLMVAQDVGSAIKGPERGDIYFGSGAKAGKLAGVTSHRGRFFVLLPNSEQARERRPWQKTKSVERAER
jgi:peptidoglycan lytic transglycosylase A